jgi:CRP-like cAMP-binding protein
MSVFQKVMFLKTTDFFADTPEELLAKIAPKLDEVEIEAGKQVLVQGQPNDSIYMIVDGAIRIHRGANEIVSLETSETFGEMGILDPNATASATVSTTKPTRMIRLEGGAFLDLLDKNADIAQNMLLVMAQRLRTTTDRIEHMSKAK